VARYYFHIRCQGFFLADPTGIDLTDIDVGGEECCEIIRDVLSEERWLTDSVDGRRFEIADESGHTVSVLPFANSGTRRGGMRARAPRQNV
jgi:hypothetical protein